MQIGSENRRCPGVPPTLTHRRRPDQATPEDWQAARALIRPGTPHPDAARTLERLGLFTLAERAGAAHPTDAPGDRIASADWNAHADEVALALIARGLLDRTEAAQARERMAGIDHFRASDGSRVWQAPDGSIGGLAGNITETDPTDTHPPARQDGFPAPAVLIGIDPPAMLHRLWRESAPRANGYAPRLFACEPDPAAAIAGLTDLAMRLGPDAIAPMLGPGRIEWFLGASCVDRLTARIERGLDEALPQRVHLTPGTPHIEQARRIAGALERAHDAQQLALRGVASRPAAWEPKPLTDRPGRVQILTSRYTAYVRFSAEDLARQFRSLGIDAQVLQERDASSHANPLYFARHIDDFRPDLIVCINYLRPHTAGAVPPGVPMISWIQDAMPHLMGGDRSWRAGRHDFAAGFIYPSLREDFGFPPEQTLRWTNPVSTGTFHPAPVESDPDNLRCEVAMATRHSEPPRSFFERGVNAFGPGTPVGRAAQRIGTSIGPILESAATPWRYLSADLADLTARCLRDETGVEPTKASASVLHESFTLPLADLLFRQQTATWAAAIADRRGWRLRLYGPGWTEHPTLGRFGRPELTHGEQLRAAYQLATVHLHASVRAPVHQRLAEIAFSGGMPLVRRTFENLDRSRRCLLNQLHGVAPRDLSMARGRHPAYWIANHPEAMRIAAEWGRLGYTLTEHGFFGNSPAEIARIEATPPEDLPVVKDDPNRLLIDLAETTFASEAELETRIEAMMNAPRRARLSSAIAGRCRDRFGLDRFARGLLDLARHRAS